MSPKKSTQWKWSKAKFAGVAAAIVIGAGLIGAPAALARGAGMGMHAGSMGMHAGSMGMHTGVGAWHGAGMAWHGAGVGWRGAGVGWRGAGVGWRGAGWHGRFFPHRHFAFFHHRRFFGPFFGLYASGYGSCWTWVPTPAGWRYVWACGPYDYGYY